MKPPSFHCHGATQDLLCPWCEMRSPHQTIPLTKSWVRFWMKPVLCSLLSFPKSKQIPLLLGFLKNGLFYFFFYKNGSLDFLYLLRHSGTDTDVHIFSPCSSPKISPHPHGHWLKKLTEFSQSQDQIKWGIVYLILFTISSHWTVPRSHHHNLVLGIKSLLSKRTHCVLSGVQTMVQIL